MTAAAGGVWLRQQATEHRCARPVLPPPRDPHAPKDGDVWQCSTCLTKWVVRHHSDQRDGDYLTFAEVNPNEPITIAVVIPPGWTGTRVQEEVARAARTAT